MHGVCADVLNGKPWPAPTKIDEEAEAHCRVYTDYVQNLAKDTGGKLFVEQWISAAKVDEDVSGTADAIVYDAKNFKLYVLDFKFGAGIAVEAKGNKQMRCYALASLFTFSDFRVDEIEMVIVQPRAFHEAGRSGLKRFQRWTFWSSRASLNGLRTRLAIQTRNL